MSSQRCRFITADRERHIYQRLRLKVHVIPLFTKPDTTMKMKWMVLCTLLVMAFTVTPAFAQITDPSDPDYNADTDPCFDARRALERAQDRLQEELDDIEYQLKRAGEFDASKKGQFDKAIASIPDIAENVKDGLCAGVQGKFIKGGLKLTQALVQLGLETLVGFSGVNLANDAVRRARAAERRAKKAGKAVAQALAELEACCKRHAPPPPPTGVSPSDPDQPGDIEAPEDEQEDKKKKDDKGEEEDKGVGPTPDPNNPNVEQPQEDRTRRKVNEDFEKTEMTDDQVRNYLNELTPQARKDLYNLANSSRWADHFNEHNRAIILRQLDKDGRLKRQ